MSDTRTENDALIEAISNVQTPDELEPGSFYAYKLGDHVQTIDLLDRNLDRPRRKTGTIRVDDITSFVQYYKKHSDPDSEVFVNVDAGVITAVLDAHESSDPDIYDTARWGEHRLIFALKQTDAWKRWTGVDRQLIRQSEFADFIDDNRGDIRKPAAAEMLELVQHFQAIQKVTFQSSTVLSNGDRRLTFAEETAAGAGAKGDLIVPSTLELGIAPFEDSDPYVVTARFRYRIQNGGLSMGFLMDNADDVLRDAVKTVVGKVEAELEIQVMRGCPTS